MFLGSATYAYVHIILYIYIAVSYFQNVYSQKNYFLIKAISDL